MQQINPVKALLTERRAEPPASSLPTTTPIRTLAKLWILGIGAWGHKWTSSLGELPMDDGGILTAAGALWSQQLAGLSEHNVLKAIQHFAGRLDWPPSLAEIRKHAMGIPDIDFVRADINTRSHGFTRMVWQYLDHWMFTRADTRDADRQLRTAYDFAVERRMCGDEFPPLPAGELEYQEAPVVVAPPESVKRYLEEVSELLQKPMGEAEVQRQAKAAREVPLSQVEQDLADHYASLATTAESQEGVE